MEESDLTGRVSLTCWGEMGEMCHYFIFVLLIFLNLLRLGGVGFKEK